MKNGINQNLKFKIISSFIFILTFIGLTSGCASLNKTARHPNSSDPVTLPTQKKAFYVAQLPQNLRSETIFNGSEINSLFDDCRHSEYGKWIQASTDSNWISQKESFLLRKLNRPFYSYYFSDDTGLHVIGRPVDFKELS